MKTLREKFPWMTDDQEECYQLLADLYQGAHHLGGVVKEWGTGVQLNTSRDFSTFDFNLMTVLVVLAHDRMIRAEITHSGPGLVRVCLWKRKSRGGRMYERHPTLESHIQQIREEYPQPQAKESSDGS